MYTITICAEVNDVNKNTRWEIKSKKQQHHNNQCVRNFLFPHHQLLHNHVHFFTPVQGVPLLHLVSQVLQSLSLRKRQHNDSNSASNSGVSKDEKKYVVSHNEIDHRKQNRHNPHDN